MSRKSLLLQNSFQRSSNTPSFAHSFGKQSALPNRTLNQSGYGSRNQSLNQSNLVAETSYHVFQSYGAVLPVLVIEAISEAATIQSVSVKIQEDGWCWLVCGRRLFVWRSIVSKAPVCSCYELQLPPSDLSHKADLICLVTKYQIPGLIAVSPEGIVRYWPSIAYAGHSSETTTPDLQGQECFSLTSIEPLGCILGTTTSTLVHVTINSSDSSSVIICHTLKVPQGVLAGLSKKVTSFIFGGLPAAQNVENRALVKILRQAPKVSEAVNVFVLAGSVLQKWSIASSCSEHLVYEMDLDRSLREAFLDYKVWNRESTHPDDLQLWQLDAEIRSDGELVLLIAGLNSAATSQLYYVLATIKDLNMDHSNTKPLIPVELSSFTILKSNPVLYAPEEEERLLNLKILSIPSKPIVYIYNQSQVLCVQYERDVLDVMNFGEHGNLILGAGVCEKIPLLFTAKDGLVAVKPNQDFSFIEAFEEPAEAESIDVEDSDTIALRKAFNMFRRRETAKTLAVVNDKFLNNNAFEIDEVVAELSFALCDEFPISDPRWAETSPLPVNIATASVLLTNQLEEKLKVHQLYIEFVRATGIWDKLTVASHMGIKVNTQTLLCENTEKIMAAITLKRLHADFGEVLEPVIKIVLNHRGKVIPQRLTYQDVFYKDITRINEIFSALIDYEQAQVSNSCLTSKHLLKLLLVVCSILISTLQEVSKFRSRNSQLYNSIRKHLTDHIPWSSSLGAEGVRAALFKQFDLLVTYGLEAKSSTKPLPVEEDMQLKIAIHQKLVDLVDLILEGYVYQLSFLPPESEKFRALMNSYETERTKCIEPLLTVRQYERAVSLAEKYEDFDILIRVCEDLDSKDRLQRYMNEFSSKGFSEYLFRWYLKHGKMGKMMSTNFSALGSFLNDYKSLQWLHQIGAEQFRDASETLKVLAESERQYVSRQKTLLSLSKLAGVADGEEDFTSINKMQDLILYQESVPPPVLEVYGINYDTMKPLTPEQLIEMYICEENSEATEVDFKKALDLTRYIEEDGKGAYCVRDYRLRILSAAIKRDNWNTFSTDSPLEFIKETIFFRLMDLAVSQGDDINEFLPPSDVLLNAEELQDLSRNPVFVYLVKAAYECISKFNQA